MLELYEMIAVAITSIVAYESCWKLIGPNRRPRRLPHQPKALQLLDALPEPENKQIVYVTRKGQAITKEQLDIWATRKRFETCLPTYRGNGVYSITKDG